MWFRRNPFSQGFGLFRFSSLTSFVYIASNCQSQVSSVPCCHSQRSYFLSIFVFMVIQFSLNASDIPLQSMGLSAKRCRLSDLKFYKLSRTSIKWSIRTSDKELFIHLWLSVSMLGNLWDLRLMNLAGAFWPCVLIDLEMTSIVHEFISCDAHRWNGSKLPPTKLTFTQISWC